MVLECMGEGEGVGLGVGVRECVCVCVCVCVRVCVQVLSVQCIRMHTHTHTLSHTQGGDATRKIIGGGLHTLFSMVMAGLAGQTPHMIRCN